MTDTKEREISPERLAQIMALMHQPGNHSTSNVTVSDTKNDAVRLIAALMLGLNVGLGLIVLDQYRQIADLRHHVTAIYMMAPHLQPKEPQD